MRVSLFWIVTEVFNARWRYCIPQGLKPESSSLQAVRLKPCPSRSRTLCVATLPGVPFASLQPASPLC
jgi:hypothetical protein